jgi:hypothetical protein
MSLVIAFIGTRGSVVGGDMREITLQEESPGSDQFEEELYSGRIRTDEEMTHRAQELGIHLGIRDTKKKVRERDGILIGEVSDFEHGIIRKRRLYVTTGRYALAEIESQQFIRIRRGEATRFVVLGSPFIQEVTNEYIRERWKSGGLAEAVHLVQEIMEAAARKSASVSREFLIVKTASTIDLEPIMEQDQKGGK